MTLNVYSGGIASSTTVNSNGNVILNKGGVARGTTINSSGGVDASGAYINFELDDRSASQGVILDNIGHFYSVERYSMEVDVDQAPGTYKITAGASAFNDRITLYVEEGVDCGSLAVGEALDYAGRRYTLVRNDGVLALNIS